MAVIAIVTTRPTARRVATVEPARSIWHRSQPPKMSPCGLVSAGMAMARSAGSDAGSTSGASAGFAVGSAMRAPSRPQHDLAHRLAIGDSLERGRDVGERIDRVHVAAEPAF